MRVGVYSCQMWEYYWYIDESSKAEMEMLNYSEIP